MVGACQKAVRASGSAEPDDGWTIGIPTSVWCGSGGGSALLSLSSPWCWSFEDPTRIEKQPFYPDTSKPGVNALGYGKPLLEGTKVPVTEESSRRSTRWNAGPPLAQWFRVGPKVLARCSAVRRGREATETAGDLWCPSTAASPHRLEGDSETEKVASAWSISIVIQNHDVDGAKSADVHWLHLDGRGTASAC